METRYFRTYDKLYLRYAVWRTKKMPSAGKILLFQGRAEYLEKYLETVGALNAKGYDVYAFDWRGQGGSSRMLPNPRKGYVRSFDDYLTDLEGFVEGVFDDGAEEGIRCMMGHSMGGHMILRYLSERATAGREGDLGGFDCAVLLAPMMAIDTSPFPEWLARRIARIGRYAPADQWYAPGQKDWPTLSFDGNRQTSDPFRHGRMVSQYKLMPGVAIGGVTFGWLNAAFLSAKHFQNGSSVRNIRTPVLVVKAEKEAIVSNPAIDRLVAEMTHCTLHTIRDSRHEILHERETPRNTFWDHFDRFMKMVADLKSKALSP